MAKKLLIISYGRYPNGNAGAVREHIFAKAYRTLGYDDITVIGMGNSTGFRYMEYDGVKYTSLRHKNTDKVHKIMNKFFYQFRLYRELKKMEPDLVLVVDIPILAMLMVKRYFTKRKVALIHDSVEWYSKEEFKYGLMNPEYIHKEIVNRKIIDKKFKVIAISKYLENHFSGKGISTVRIPFVLDTEIEVQKNNDSNEKFVIMYAGNAGKKDYFSEIVDGLLMLDEEQRKRVEFRVFGCRRESVISTGGVEEKKLKELSDAVKFFGKVPREQILKNYETADFTIFVRSDTLRYAKAGFPTKVTESLTYCTPVITNLTSDLEDYLQDGYNAVVVEECSADAVCKAFEKVLTYDRNHIAEMCLNSGSTAKQKLDYRLFMGCLKKLDEK